MNDRPSLILTEDSRHAREKLTDMSPGIVFQLNIGDEKFMWLKAGMAYTSQMIKNLQPHLKYDPEYRRLKNSVGP